MLYVAFLFFLAVASVAPCDFCGPFDVTSETLPSYVGVHPFPFKSSTGYVVVNETAQRNIFYWLTESSSNPETDPLVFWYQGGPGCSGLGGLFTEHGPFHVNLDNTISLSDFTWNSVANMVYLEQPCGVGFSWDGLNEYKTGDNQAATDNFAFIEGFLAANPQYLGRDIWLAGESYAGVYIPMLAQEILNHPTSDTYKQFSGLMNGNPVFDHCLPSQQDVQINIFFWHQLISYKTISAWNDNECGTTNIGSSVCNKIYTQANREKGKTAQEIGEFSFNGTQPSVDIDNLYQDFIVGNGSLEWVKTLVTADSATLDEALITYLNRQDVQTAIHAHQPHKGNWNICGGVILYGRSHGNLIPYYQNVIKQRPDVHILIYSGDVDVATVPAPLTQRCLETLDGTDIPGREWSPWFTNGATSGYVEYFEEYTYATVKGAGHTVPTYMPLSSMNLFQRFIQNQNLDGGEVYFDKKAKPQKRSRRREGDMLRFHGLAIDLN